MAATADKEASADIRRSLTAIVDFAGDYARAIAALVASLV
jgi:hypothetical protein